MTDLPWVLDQRPISRASVRVVRDGNLHVVNRGSGRESGPEVFLFPVPATLAIGQLVRDEAHSQVRGRGSGRPTFRYGSPSPVPRLRRACKQPLSSATWSSARFLRFLGPCAFRL